MPVKLDPIAIVNSFKNRLPLMSFIPDQHHTDISQRLDVLIDIENGRTRRESYSRLAKTEAAHWLWDKLFTFSFSTRNKLHWILLYASAALRKRRRSWWVAGVSEREWKSVSTHANRSNKFTIIAK